MQALQEAAEAWLIGCLEQANLYAIHAKRVIVTQWDLLLVRHICGIDKGLL